MDPLRKGSTWAVGIGASFVSPVFGYAKLSKEIVEKIYLAARNRLGLYKNFLETTSGEIKEKEIAFIRKNIIFKKLVEVFGKELKISDEDLVKFVKSEEVQGYLNEKIKKYIDKEKEIHLETLISCSLLVPFVGATLGYAAHLAKEGTKQAVGPDKEKPVYDAALYTRMMLFPLTGNTLSSGKVFNLEDLPKEKREQHIEIPVNFKAGLERKLDAIHMVHPNKKGEPNSSIKTVVIYHPNYMTCEDMREIGNYYFNKGFNVLVPTIGGYPGSTGVIPSEESVCQDVEAVKLFLEAQGVKEVGYHGMSLGASLAIKSATNPTNAQKLQTSFVVSDQGFKSAVEVAENAVRNSAIGIRPIRWLGKAIMRIGLEKGKEIDLGKGVKLTLNGFDNVQSLQGFQKGTRFCTITAEKDKLTGEKDGGDHADALLTAAGQEESRNRYILKDQGHASFFTSLKDESRQVAASLTLWLKMNDLIPQEEEEPPKVAVAPVPVPVPLVDDTNLVSDGPKPSSKPSIAAKPKPLNLTEFLKQREAQIADPDSLQGKTIVDLTQAAASPEITLGDYLEDHSKKPFKPRRFTVR